MTDFHTDNHPAHLDPVEAQSAQRAPKFWWMFVISTTLVVIAMIAIFLTVAG